jgi:hypothetical protein
LRVSENRVLRRIFGPRRDEVTGDWRKIHHEELHNLYSPPNFIVSCPATRHGGAWGDRRYSPYSFLTSVVDRGEWSALRPGRALPPRKGPPVPIGQEAGWAPEPVWTQGLEETSFYPARD